MAYCTFMKFMNSYHIDVAIQRAKEDTCDTCTRLSVTLSDPDLREEERVLLQEAKSTHANDARTQRIALKEAIKVTIRTAASYSLY